MNTKRDVSFVVFLLFCAAVVGACGTRQVRLQPTPASTPGLASPASVTATRSSTATATHIPAPPSPTAIATAIATARADATPTPLPSPTVDVAPGWETYRSERFSVRFRYPPDWEFDAVHGGETYRGEDGYFILDAIGSGGATIDGVVADQVDHPLLPYGTDPAIEELEVGGQQARLTLPAADASMGDQAMLIVRYPQPVTILGRGYDYFALYADEAHIRTIAQTLQFVPGTGTQGATSPWERLVAGTPVGWAIWSS